MVPPPDRCSIFCVLAASLALACGLDCWAGDFTEATCCDLSLGPQGNPSCWDGRYTYEACCSNARRSVVEAGSSGKKKKAKPQSVAKKKVPIDGVVVGIDLGTTYSAVAVLRGGRPEVIPNDQGNRITPSVVAFMRGGERLVGEAAKNVMGENPRHVVYDAKRLIGRGFSDRSVQMDRKSFPFRVVDRGGRPHIEVEKADGKAAALAPEEISAMVLMKMRAIAEAYLGEEVRHAVVTVPAYFNDNQRFATKVAGEIAGLNVVRVLNEPTAAAIAYGFEHRNPRKRGGRSETRILVYDLGGGTFDVSLLSVDNGVFETLATCGNTHLGGEDFDRRVVDYVAGQFKAKTGKDPSKDMRAMQRLKAAVEAAKRTLSLQVSATVEVDGFFRGMDLREPLSRSKFEHLNEDLFTKTLEPLKRVLKDAGLGKQDVDEVVLVGGSTRIPKIQHLIQSFFELPKPPRHKVNPDETVAIGAAIQGELLWRGSAEGQALASSKSWDIVLVDVTPLSLGIEVNNGGMAVIVPRNTALPTMKTQTYTTVHDHQTTVYIPIYQGERSVAKKNNKLGQMILSGIAPAPVGVPQVDVTFRIDANGILEVTAKDKGTGQAASVSISAEKGRLSEEEVERMLQKARRHAEQDRELLMRKDARAGLEAYIESLKGTVLGAAKLPEGDREALKEALREVEDWLRGAAKASADELRDRRAALEEVANPIVARLYGRPAPAPPPSEDDAGGSAEAEEDGGDEYEEYYGDGEL